jgi:hypothetical protein
VTEGENFTVWEDGQRETDVTQYHKQGKKGLTLFSRDISSTLEAKWTSKSWAILSTVEYKRYSGRSATLNVAKGGR